MLDGLDRLLKYLLTFLVGLLTVSVFLQVLIRFVFKYPLPWTEEVSRIAFVYIDLHRGHHRRPGEGPPQRGLPAGRPPCRAWLAAVRGIGVAWWEVFLAFVTWQGIVFVQATGVQITPVMQIPFRYLYLVIPLSGGAHAPLSDPGHR